MKRRASEPNDKLLKKGKNGQWRAKDKKSGTRKKSLLKK